MACQGLQRGLMALLLLAVTGMTATVRADSVDLGGMDLDAAQNVCRNSVNTSPWQSGIALAAPGRWWNPKRYGTGWDLVYSDDRSQLKVFLYTYDANGHPVWLASNMVNIHESGDSWTADLFEHTKKVGEDTLNAATNVGKVYFRFFRDDPSRMAIRWRWKDIPASAGQPHGGYLQECLNDMTRLNPTYYTGFSDAPQTTQLFDASTSSTPGLNQTFSGYWSDQNHVDAVPGVVMTIMQTSLGQYEGQLGEAAVWLTFNETPEDGKRKPIFLQAQRTTLRSWLPFDTDTFDLYLHYSRDYTHGFATTDCTRRPPTPPNDPGVACVSDHRVGTYTRKFLAETNYRRALASYTIDPAIANGIVANPVALRTPVKLRTSGESMTVNRMTQLQDISVNRYVCAPAAPALTCDVFVSWSGNGVGRPWKRDLGTMRYDAAPISTQDIGIEPVMLKAGDRFQLELWAGTPGVPGALLLDKAPEIRGVTLESASEGIITVPAAEVVSNAEDLSLHDPTVGAVAGSAAVDGGAATYTVPIQVPPGRAGLQPALSLSYSSRGGNGVAGLGWSLSAGSSIQRCPRTIGQDGVVRGVRLDADDRLCLDGQRLVTAPNSRPYGSDRAEYRTEIESFSKVTQSGSLANGDVCFTVQQKNGRTLTYGCMPVAQPACAGGVAPRVQPSGKSVELSWLLSRVEDPTGNTMEFCYESGADASEVLLKTIAYTGSVRAGATAAVAAPSRSVLFDYEARPTDWRANDRSSSWLAGGGLQQSKRLTTIRTYSPDSQNPARQYELDYRDIAATELQYSYTSGRSLLRRVFECTFVGTQKTCLKPTEFTWTDGTWVFANRRFAVSPPAAQQPAPATDPPAGQEMRHTPDYKRNRIETTGDLDGDGAREWWIVKLWYDGMPRTEIQIAKVNADRVTQGVVTITGLSPFARSADFDGDGITELLDGQTIYKWKRGRGAPMCDGSATSCTATAASYFTTATTNLPTGEHFLVAGVADFNGDGAADVLVSSGLLDPCPVSSIVPETVDGQLPTGCSPLHAYLNTRPGPIPTNAPSSFNFTPSTMLGVLNAGSGTGESVQHLTDFNGDGTTDIVVGRADGVRRIMLSTLTGTVLGSTELSAQAAGFSGTTSNLRWLDVNGDGLDDALSVLLPAAAGSCRTETDCFGYWKLQLNSGGALLMPAELSGATTAGLRYDGLRGTTSSAPMLRYFNKLVPSDIDADGRGDLLYPARFAVRMCFGARLTHNRFIAPRPAKECPEEPVHGPTCAADVCAAPPPEDGNAWAEHPHNGIDAADAFSSGLGAYDPSVYRFNALRFVQTGANAFRLQVDETSVIAAASVLGNQAGRIDDYFGDGLADVVSDVACPLRPTALFPLNTCSLAAGGTAGPGTADGRSFIDSAQTIRMGDLVSSSNINPLINENQGDGLRASGYPPVFPDLLAVAVNGLKERATWDYYPLSSGAGRNADFPLYRIDGGYVDRRRFLFQSSMPVVAQLARSHAALGGTTGLAANGSRSMRYSYTGAMYDSEGRGFQGFRQIAAETLGSPDRTLRTVTTFHQKFPLTGRIERVEVRVPQVAGDNGLISLETTSWQCHRNDRTQGCPGQGDSALAPGSIHWPYVGTSTREVFDLAKAQNGTDSQLVSTTTTVNGDPNSVVSGWDAYGNLTFQQTATKDGAGVAAGERHVLAHQTSTVVSSYDASVVGQWWIDKLVSTTTVNSIGYLPRLRPGTAEVMPEPAGISLSPKKIKREFDWHGDRTPNWSIVSDLLSDMSVRTDYGYAGSATRQPTSVIVSGTRIQPARETRTAYTDDEHFPFSVTAVLGGNAALDHVTTTVTRASDGQPLAIHDPNGLKSAYTYDAFGRTTQVTSSGNDGLLLAPPSRTSLTLCAPACTGADEGFATYYQSTVADGAPSQRIWFDLLGREVKRATRSFDGRWAAVATRYDAQGAVSQVSAPYFAGETPLNTTATYDRLSRVLSKRSPTSELNAEQGDMQTTYVYDGHETRITVSPVSNATALCAQRPNLCLQMRRQHDAQGRLVRTIDAQGGVTDHWVNPMGNVAALRDANGQATLAYYNSFGQRTQSKDPNQGTWSFVYNGLGELVTQTDARGVLTRVLQRDAMGRVLQQQREPASPQSLPEGFPDEKLLDSWQYDPIGAKGQAALIARRRASAATPDVDMADAAIVWQESYAYAPASTRLTRRSTQMERAAPGPLTLETDYQYDRTYGYLNGVTYPNPLAPSTPQRLTVWKRYTRYGALSGLVDARMMTPLWTLWQTDVYGKPTKEQFGYALYGYADYSRATGQMRSQSWRPFDVPSFEESVDKSNYGYDALGNLISQDRWWMRYDTGQQGSVYLRPDSAERFGRSQESLRYDTLQRLVSVDNLVRQHSEQVWQDAPAWLPRLEYSYDAVGNITSKTNFADVYAYGNAGTVVGAGGHCGPNALKTTYHKGLARNYRCDANGNQITQADTGAGAEQRSVVYDASNQPTKIRHYDPWNASLPGAPRQTTFAYGPGNARYYRNEDNAYQGFYGSDGFEYEIQTGGYALYRVELGPVVYTRAVQNGVAKAAQTAYQLRDRLGSTIAVADRWGHFNGTGTGPGTADGRLRRSYDPFGAPRDPDHTWTNVPTASAQPILQLGDTTRRGFTDHEHLDSVRLTHMNGRVYDYRSGRFLSVDPLIQAPGDSQSVNPYSYIFNNPLSGTDPTGYAACVSDPKEQCSDLGPARQQFSENAGFAFGGFAMLGGSPFGNGTLKDPLAPSIDEYHAAVIKWANDIGALGSRKPSFGPARSDGGSLTLLDGWDITPKGGTRREYAVAYHWWMLPGWQKEMDAWVDRYARDQANRSAVELGTMLGKSSAVTAGCVISAGGCAIYGAIETGQHVYDGNYKTAAATGVLTAIGLRAMAGSGAAVGTSSRLATSTEMAAEIVRVRQVSVPLSVQKQMRHVAGESYRHGGYFTSVDDAKQVYEAFLSGRYEPLGFSNGNLVIRVPEVSAMNVNRNAGFVDQPTNVFFIKGSTSPSIVPANPNWTSK